MLYRSYFDHETPTESSRIFPAFSERGTLTNFPLPLWILGIEPMFIYTSRYNYIQYI